MATIARRSHELSGGSFPSRAPLLTHGREWGERDKGGRCKHDAASPHGTADEQCGAAGGGPGLLRCRRECTSAPCSFHCMELEPGQLRGDGRRVLHTPRGPGLSPGTKDEGRSDRRQRPSNCVLDTEAPRIQKVLGYRDDDSKRQPTQRAPGPPRTQARAPSQATERRQRRQAAGRRLPAIGGGPPPPLQNPAGRRTPAPGREPARREAAEAGRRPHKRRKDERLTKA